MEKKVVEVPSFMSKNDGDKRIFRRKGPSTTMTLSAALKRSKVGPKPIKKNAKLAKESVEYVSKGVAALKTLQLDEVKAKGLTIKGVRRHKKVNGFKKKLLNERESKLLLFKPLLKPFPYCYHPAIDIEKTNHEIQAFYPVDVNICHPAFWPTTEVLHRPELVGTKDENEKLLKSRIDNSAPIRMYITQALSSSLDQAVFTMLRKLFLLQKKLVDKDPVKAKSKRRIVLGMREVLRGLKLGKVICVIVAINGEENATADERLFSILNQCHYGDNALDYTTSDGLIRKRAQVIFSLKRKNLGEAVTKRSPISCVGIQSVDGANSLYKEISNSCAQLKDIYKTVLVHKKHAICEACGLLPEFVTYAMPSCQELFCTRCYNRHFSKQQVAIKPSMEIPAVISLLSQKGSFCRIARKLEVDNTSIGIAEHLSTTEWRKRSKAYVPKVVPS